MTDFDRRLMSPRTLLLYSSSPSIEQINVRRAGHQADRDNESEKAHPYHILPDIMRHFGRHMWWYF